MIIDWYFLNNEFMTAKTKTLMFMMGVGKDEKCVEARNKACFFILIIIIQLISAIEMMTPRFIIYVEYCYFPFYMRLNRPSI